jgi:importin-5
VSQVCDTVSELAASIMEKPGWPELLPFIFQCVQSGDPRLMESALLVFAQLARHIMATLTQYMGTLHEVLGAALGHSSVDVRIAAMHASTAFVQVRPRRGRGCAGGCRGQSAGR